MIAARIRPSPEADLDNATVNESQELESGRVRSDPRLVRFDGPVAFTSVQQQLARRMGQDSRHIHRPLIEDVRGYFRSAYAVGFYHNHDFVDTLRFIGTSFSTKLDSLVHQRLSMAVLWKDAEIPTERFKRIVGALAGTIRGNSSSLELYPLLLLPDEPHWMIRSLFARMNNYAQSSNRLLTTMQMRSNYFGTASERLIPPWFMNDLGVRGTNGWIKRGRRPPRVQPHPLRPRERIEWRDFKVGGDAEREAVATLLAATDLRINGHRVATNLHRFSQLALYYNGQNDVMAALPVLTDARAHTYLRPPSNGHHVSLCPTISLHDRQLPQAAIHRYMHHLLLEWETRLVTKTVFIVTDMDAWPRPFRNARFRQHFGPWVAVLQQTPAQPLFVPRPLSSPTMYAWTVVTNDALIKARRLAFAQFGVNLHHTDVHSQVAVLLWKDGRLIGTLVSTKTEDYGVVIQCTALVHTESNVRLVEMLQKLQEVTVQRDAGAATLHVFGRDRINARPEPVPVSYSALMHAGFHGTSAPYWKKREPRTLPQLDPRVYRVASIDIQKSLSEKGQRETEEAVMALVRLTRSGAANLINPPSWGYGRMVTFVHTIEHVESRCLIYLTVCNASTEDRRDMAGMGSSVTALQTSWTDGCFVADVQPPTTARHTAMNVHVMRMWQESSDALEFLINEQQGTREEGFIPLGFPFMWKQTPDAVPPLVDVDAELGEEKEPAAKRVRTSARIVYDPVVEQDDPVVNRATDIVPFQMEGATFVGGPILQPDLLTDLDTATTTNTNFLSEMVMDYATPQYSTTLHSPLKELGAFDILTGQLFYPLTQLARHVSQPKTAQWELVLLWRKTKNEVIKTPVGAIFVTGVRCLHHPSNTPLQSNTSPSDAANIRACCVPCSTGWSAAPSNNPGCVPSYGQASTIKIDPRAFLLPRGTR